MRWRRMVLEGVSVERVSGIREPIGREPEWRASWRARSSIFVSWLLPAAILAEE